MFWLLYIACCRLFSSSLPRGTQISIHFIRCIQFSAIVVNRHAGAEIVVPTFVGILRRPKSHHWANCMYHIFFRVLSAYVYNILKSHHEYWANNWQIVERAITLTLKLMRFSWLAGVYGVILNVATTNSAATCKHEHMRSVGRACMPITILCD